MNLTRVYLIVALVLAVGGLSRADESRWKPEATYRAGQQDVGELITKAESAQQEKQYKSALKYYRIIEKESVNLRNRARAIVAQGYCQMRLGEQWKAYKLFRRALDDYATFVPFEEVLDYEFQVAGQFFGSKGKQVLGMRFSSDHMAAEIYDHIVEVAPYSRQAPEALYQSGVLTMNMRSYEESADKFRRLLNRYPRSEVAGAAYVALADVLLRAAEQGDGDGLKVREARRQLSRFFSRHPDHEGVARARELELQAAEIEAGRLLELARFYVRKHHRRAAAARRYLKEVITDYPGTASAAEAEELLAELGAGDGGEAESSEEVDGAAEANDAGGGGGAGEAEAEPAPAATSTESSRSGGEAPDAAPAAVVATPTVVEGRAERPKRPASQSEKYLLPIDDLGDPTRDTP